MESQVVGKTEAEFLEEEQLGKLGKEEDVEKEPATERMREYIDLGERDQRVACHSSALVLAMTDEACREAEM